ncbi:Hypothetical protein A7982_11069 [Minicystis rosea]|nr:Hypothetical protein A7982_11069 [Minicystis rosea]
MGRETMADPRPTCTRRNGCFRESVSRGKAPARLAFMGA